MFLFERNPRSTIKKGRKAPKTTVVCCRTSDALKAEVDALCRRNNLTTSELVKNFIEECVKRDSTTWWEGEAQKRIELDIHGPGVPSARTKSEADQRRPLITMPGSSAFMKSSSNTD